MTKEDELSLVGLKDAGVPLIFYINYVYGDTESTLQLGDKALPLSEVNDFSIRLNKISWDSLRCEKCNGKMVKSVDTPLIPVLHECSDCKSYEKTYTCMYRHMNQESKI